LTQQIEIANTMIENKLLSREWIYNNIFEFNKDEKENLFSQIVEDRKQVFRFEQIESEGNDPAESGEKAGDDDDLEVARKGEWGGSEKDRFKKDVNPNGAKSEDLKNATSYDRERYGKREFKGGSPLAVGKGGTIVAREGLLNQLKQKFGQNTIDKSILSEDVILNDEDSE
jgi:hypothetical protein